MNRIIQWLRGLPFIYSLPGHRDPKPKNGLTKDFGPLTDQTESTFRGRYAWTGREMDTEINLQYNRARYYDPRVGRWVPSS